MQPCCTAMSTLHTLWASHCYAEETEREVPCIAHHHHEELGVQAARVVPAVSLPDTAATGSFGSCLFQSLAANSSRTCLTIFAPCDIVAFTALPLACTDQIEPCKGVGHGDTDQAHMRVWSTLHASSHPSSFASNNLVLNLLAHRATQRPWLWAQMSP